MLYLTREDSVGRLPLSTRASNCLRRANIHTVGQMLDYPPDAWLDIRNMGKKSVQEIMDLIARIQNDNGFSLTESRPEPAELPPVVTPPYLSGISLLELGLSFRARSCLEQAGIFTAADLGGVTSEFLLSLKNVGQKTAREIMEKVEELRRQFPQDAWEPTLSPGEEVLQTVAKRLADFTGMPQGELLRLLVPCREDAPDADAEALLGLAFQQAPVRREARRAVLRLLEQYEEAVRPEDLLERLPAGTSLSTLKRLLGDLLRREQIAIRNNHVCRRWPTALEFVERVSDPRHRDILLSRLRGETLEEIGQRLGLSRERIRQLTIKALDRRPRLQEDRYQYLYNHYDFSQEDFRIAFSEPEETYYYLEMIRPKGDRKPLQELLADESVPVSLRRKAERAVYKHYVTIEGTRVLKSRPALAEYLIRTRCQEPSSLEEFLQHYQNLLEALGLDGEPKLVIELRTYENKFNASSNVLWSQWRRFRYYPITEQDFTPLLEALNLEQYEDMEISSLKLFRDYPELMREYDIRDEYELHNLLKKIWPQDDGHVHFKRMPTIKIGAPDRDRQVMDLLLQYAPIANTELAQRYEEAYGAKGATVLGSYFSCIESYFHGGLYQIDQPSLPEERRNRMAELLTADFYRTEELRRLYQREFPGADPKDLNPFVLKDLGFRTYTDYAVSTRYPNAADYFRHFLADRDVVDMTQQNRRYAGLSSYSSELNDLKSQREIVEFLPLQYISLRRLQSIGVDAGALTDYCAAVHAFTRSGRYFTVASLRGEGFAHPLDDLGFDDWFYGSLLAEDPERFSYCRMGGTRLFRRDGGRVLLADFLCRLVEAKGRMEIYDLQETLEQRYGIAIPVHKLTAAAQASELYYDAIMKTVYVDYDTYLEEIG